ncbi:MAG: histidine phosphatase family protein [Pseudonocardiaceae bacterium]|nr:histidine phosphatase family protein [Pseudonocardiaceae bacterium]
MVLRHAKSAWPEGVPDIERPLAGRGRRDAPAAGRWLREHLGEIDLVVCSPATRARQTWRLVAGELAPEPESRSDDRLYGTSTEALLTVLRELPAEARSAVLVGHNPDLEDLVELLTGSAQQLKTSTIAVLTGSSSWSEAGPGWAELEALSTPRG